MGVDMVTVVPSSTTEFEESRRVALARTSSVDAAYSDPDLLIREYFLSSSNQRFALRKAIIQHVKSVRSVLEILSRGASGKAHDGYDGAVNLLAEIDNFALLRNASQTAQKAYLSMLQNPTTWNFAERFLEIFIKAIACAYQIDANQRLRLLIDFLPQANRRIIKASIIDALMIVSDEVNLNDVKVIIERFARDQDQYICDYAAEALQDLS